MTKRMKRCGCTGCRCDKRISSRPSRTPICDFCVNGIHKDGER